MNKRRNFQDKLLFGVLIISVLLSVMFVYAASDDIGLSEEDILFSDIENYTRELSEPIRPVVIKESFDESPELSEHVPGELMIKFKESTKVEKNNFLETFFLGKTKIETRFENVNKLNKKFKIDKSNKVFKGEKRNKTYKFKL